MLPFAAASPATAAAVGAINTGFEIDGGKAGGTPPGTFDWDTFLDISDDGSFDFTPTGGYTTVDGNPSSGIIDASFSWDNGTMAEACDGSDPTAFPGSVKPNANPWPIGAANVAAKADGCSSGSAYEVVSADDGDHVILYQYWTRLSGNGDMSTYQILEGGQDGRCDDYLIEFNYDSNGGGNTTINVLDWNGSCAVGGTGTWVVSAGNLAHDAAVGVRVEGPSLPAGAETFGEIAVDLTAAGLFDAESCTAFTAGGFVTRTGNSPTAELIDSIGAGNSPLAISNCGSLTVNKAASPADATSEDIFEYTVARAGGGNIHEESPWPPAGLNDIGDSTATIVSNIGVGDTQDWTPVFAANDYTIAEAEIAADSPWVFSSLTCTVTPPGSTTPVVYEITGTDDTFPVYVGANTDCVITNATSYLTITKTAIGAQDQAFGFDTTGDLVADVSIVGTTDGTTSAAVQYKPGTVVTVTELLDAVNATADPQWTLDSIVGGVVDLPNDRTGVTTIAGETVNANFTNSQLGRIIVNKLVDGTDSTFDFEGTWTTGTPALPADGAFQIASADGAGSQTFTDVTPGTYTVDEILGAVGPSQPYDGTLLSCLDSVASDSGTSTVEGLTGTINLQAGETVTCTYSNTERSVITVEKVTDPDGANTPFDFVFTPLAGTATDFSLVDGEEPWTSGLIPPGTYSVEELAESGWDLTGLDCSGTAYEGTTAEIVLAAGTQVDCVFTNTAVKGAVSLTKTVDPTTVDPGFEWTFDVSLTQEPNGAPVVQQVTNADPVANWSDLTVGATYTLQETLPEGWTGGEVVCGALVDGAADAGFQFTVVPGLVLECTVENAAMPGDVTVEKSVSGIVDGTPWSFDITIDPVPTTDPAQPATQQVTDADNSADWTGLIAGVTYTLTETLPAGWEGGVIVCGQLDDASAEIAGFQFVAEPGMSLECMVENRAIPADVTIVKTSVGGDGEFEFVLTPLAPAGDPVMESVTTVDGTGEANFANLIPGGSYSLAETDPSPDWVAGPLVCTVLHAGSQEPVGIDEADFDVAAGDAFNCAITNTKQGNIVIHKTVEGANGTFDFTGSWTTGTPPLVDGGFEITTSFDPDLHANTGEATFTGVAPGTYSVSEVDPAPDYDGLFLNCLDPDQGSTTVDPLTGSIDLDPGETVECYFSNIERGSIVVDKVTVPADSEQLFDFTFTPPVGDAVEFQLADGTAPWDSGQVSAGTYTVLENSTVDWELTGLVCTPGEHSYDGGLATIVLAPGAVVTCTYTNAANPGEVSVTKSVTGVEPGTAWSFDINLTLEPDGEPVTKTVTDQAPVATWDGLVAGATYTLTEVDQEGWDEGDFTCTGLADASADQDGYQFIVTPGLVLECAIENVAEPGDVEVTKSVSGIADGTPWSFDITIDPVPTTEPAQPETQQVTDADGSVAWTGLVAGATYTLTETLPAGWEGGVIVCGQLDDASAEVAGFQFVAEPGMSLECMVENRAIPADVTIVKTSIGGDGTFDFVLTPLDPAGDPITEPVTTVNGTGELTFENLVPGGSYSLAESDPGAAWEAGTLECTVVHAGSQEPIGIDEADFDVAAGDAFNCAITNTAQGNIVIHKTVEGANGTFDFTGDWTTGSPALVDGGFEITTEFDADLGANVGEAAFSDVAPGTYSVSEIDPAPDYDGLFLNCVDPDQGSTGSDLTGTIDLDPGETVHCYFSNIQRGSIVVDKVTVPADSEQLFDFTFTPPVGDAVDFQLADGTDPWSSGQVSAGTYTVLEDPTANWELTSLVCTPGEHSYDGGLATIVLAPGAVVTCTYENTANPGEVSVTKSVTGVEPGTAWSFDVNLTLEPDGEPVTKTVTNVAPQTTWDGLVAGATYTLTEVDQEGWDEGDFTCTGLADASAEQDGYQFVVTPGLVLECAIENVAEPGDVEVSKSVSGVADGTPWSFDITIDPVPTTDPAQPATQQVTDADNTVAWTGLVAGKTYTLTETRPAGWEGGVIVCGQLDDASAEVAGFQFVAEPGMSLECMVENRAIPADVTIVKTSIGGDGEFEFVLTPLDPAGDPAIESVTTVDGTGEVTFENLVPGGSYSLAESDPGAAWEAGALECTVLPAGSQEPVGIEEADFTVAPGDVFNCAITNTAQGNIVIHKTVEGANGTFDFTGDWTTGTPALVDGGFEITTEFDADLDANVGEAAFSDVAPGTYSVSEIDPAPDYDGLFLNCLDPDQGSTTVDPLTGSIDLDPGETVHCYFSNIQRGSITVDKTTVPANSEQLFDFTFTPPVGDAVDFQLADGTEPWSSGQVSAGTYTVLEDTTANWELTGLVCTPGEHSYDGGLATIVLAPGAVVTCTYENTADPGKVSVTKSVTGVKDGTPWSFDINLTQEPEGPTVTKAVTDVAPLATWSDLVVGATYTLTEDDQEGWNEGDFSCTGLADASADQDGYQFVVTPGLVLECTIVNDAEPGDVEVTKSVSGVADGSPWSFDITIDPVPTTDPVQEGTQQVTDGDNTVDWTGLVAGETYTLTETLPAGWEGGVISCGEVPDASVETPGFQFIATPGMSIDCMVDNNAIPGTATIVKTSVGGDGTFEFALTPLVPEGEPVIDSVTTIDGTGELNFANLIPGGSYSLAEIDPGAAWEAGALECTVLHAGTEVPVGIDEADFTVAPGDVFDCAITNTKQGKIIIVKNVVGSDNTFEFTGSWLDPEEFSITTEGHTGTAQFDNVAPGSYTVTEHEIDGYDGTLLTCTDGTTENSGTDGLTGTIELDPGETVVCTYTNTAWGVLLVDKTTIPGNDPTMFDFGWGPADSIELNPFQQSGSDDDPAFSTGPIEPGDYVVKEVAPDGWTLTDIDCIGGESPEYELNDGSTPPGSTAVVTVPLQSTVLCTFTNAKRGDITVEKSVTSAPADNGDGTYTIEYGLTVTSESNREEEYDLDDELLFGGGITPVEASVVSHDGVDLNADWNGISDTLVAENATIGALGTDTYTVTVTAEIATTVSASDANCVLGESEDGTGFLNTTQVEFWNGTSESEACAPLPVADLAVDKTGATTVQVVPGKGSVELKYTVTVTNLGPDTAVDSVMTDVVPAGLAYKSATGTDASCALIVTTVTCELGDLAAGESRVIQITVLVPDTTKPGTIHNVAVASTPTTETDLTNNTDWHDTRVVVPSPLPATGVDLIALWIALALLGAGVVAMVARRRNGAEG